MNIQTAINLKPKYASEKQLRTATNILRSSYNMSSTSISKLGYKTEIMKTVEARQTVNPTLYSTPLKELSRQELQEVYDTYRSANASKRFDPDTGEYLGWQLNQTRTKKGFLEYQENVAKNVLGCDDYTNMSYSEQQDLWDKIDRIRDELTNYFQPNSKNHIYGSSENIKQVMSWINQGYSESEIKDMLKGTTTEKKISEQRQKAAIVPDSPFALLDNPMNIPNKGDF